MHSKFYRNTSLNPSRIHSMELLSECNRHSIQVLRKYYQNTNATISESTGDSLRTPGRIVNPPGLTCEIADLIFKWLTCRNLTNPLDWRLKIPWDFFSESSKPSCAQREREIKRRWSTDLNQPMVRFWRFCEEAPGDLQSSIFKTQPKHWCSRA